MKLLDAIFKGLSKAGMRASVQRVKNPEEFYVHVGHTRVTFSLGKPNEQRSTYYAASDVRRPASELMHLDVRWFGANPEGLVLGWADRADSRLESILPQIVAHLIAAGEMCACINEHRQYQWRVDSKRRLIEAEHQRRIEAERQERARRQRLEKACIDKLLQEAMSLRLANDIRAYVAAVSNHNAEQAEPVSDSDMVAWSYWALAQADRVDPVSSRAFLQPLSEEETEESDPVQARHGRASMTTAHDPTAPAWHPNRWYTRLHR